MDLNSYYAKKKLSYILSYVNVNFILIGESGTHKSEASKMGSVMSERQDKFRLVRTGYGIFDLDL